MSQINPPGYPLPSGELGNDDIVCQLVYLPDRDEYWQAFLGALSYMSTWRAWERDDDKRGKDAASNWREAFELTMECWRMACLDELKQDVSDILDHMRNNVPCCGDIVIYGDSTVYITTIIPNYGDPPTHYGETEVEDWDEWSEYLCHSAKQWVYELAHQSNHLELALSVGGMSIGLAGFIVAAIVLYVVGGFLSGVVIMAIVSGLIAGYSANMFSDAADAIDAASDEIVCAILSGRNVAEAVETALSSGTAWDIFYSQLDYDTAIAILYEGGNGEDYLEPVADDTCACVCLHAVSVEPENSVGGVSSVGAWWTLPRRPGYGYNNVAYGTIRFNNVDPVWDYCGPMKVIDTIAASDGLDFARILTKDQDNNVIDDWYLPALSCDYSLDLLVGKTVASIYLERFQPSDGGCGIAYINVTMTYHDA